MALWTNTDPAEQYWNLYSYCGVNPVNYIDPDGEDATGAILGFIGGAALSGGITYAMTGDWNAAGWMALVGGTIGGGVGGYGIRADGLFDPILGGQISFHGSIKDKFDLWWALRSLQM